MSRLLRNITRSRTFAHLVTATLLLCGGARGDDRMTYRDADKTADVLRALAASRNARVFTIGTSTDYATDPARPAKYPILALRISADTSPDKDDDPSKNALLIECGMHSREWLATESCLSFAEYLVGNITNSQTGIPDILAGLDIWIVPLTNVSGRHLDDAYGGDPTRYSDSPNPSGWRGNGDTRLCNYGIDVARNFSRDWENAPAECSGDIAHKYRGFAPFSAPEAVALRSFVQNHMISMAVVVHTNLQKIWNIWDDDDVAGAAIATAANQLWAANLQDQNLALQQTAFGRREGQFSAWLARPSDTAGEPDIDTVRGIQTIFVELPFLDYNDAYAFPAGTGNGFHPSSSKVKDLIQRNFIPMTMRLAGAARTPGCIQTGAPACPDIDFGLVGAKLSSTPDNAGKLETSAASTQDGVVTPARDSLAVGQYSLIYRAQNFSAQAGSRDFDVQVTVDDGVNPQVQIQTYTGVGRNQSKTGQFPVNVDRADADYTVTLEVRPSGGFSSEAVDSFRLNDKKVFKFRAN